jgi:hypothetical protein
MEAENGMNIQESEEVNEAKVEQGTLGDEEVLLDKISTVGIVVRGKTYNTEGIPKGKDITFSFVSKGPYTASFKAPLETEGNTEEIAKECAEILRKHLEPAEDEILALLNEKGFTFNNPGNNDQELL